MKVVVGFIRPMIDGLWEVREKTESWTKVSSISKREEIMGHGTDGWTGERGKVIGFKVIENPNVMCWV